MAVPLAFQPIRNPDGRYLFYGGIYNNFSTDVMRQEFQPDVIIGVNVEDVALIRTRCLWTTTAHRATWPWAYATASRYLVASSGAPRFIRISISAS
jgi:predicted acylesterase/phospholipase RssA